MTTLQTQKSVLIVGGNKITLDQIIAVAKGKTGVAVNSDSRFVEQMEHSQKMLKEALQNNVPVYGVTTGYGKSCGNRMPMEVAIKNGENLLRFHGCGTGEPIGIEQIRAAMLCRMTCLAKGFSGVSIKLLEQIAEFLNRGITPVVPCEGSVGASGDLTPMSYIAACLAGEREVFYKGECIPAIEALKIEGLSPYEFEPKEPLSMMNGTSVMTGISALVVDRAHKILNASTCASALSVHALKAKADHFHPTIAEAKPYPGQIFVSKELMDLLYTTTSPSEIQTDTLETLQDPYSLRCSPQILGVLYDALQWISQWIEIEANSSNDNPILDPDTGEVLMGGNFYGGHIAFAMDSLKAALASAADMSDRQVALLVDPHLNRGLPADLVRMEGEDKLFHHGFKAMSISSSALTAEALKETMPAASFSRSTESHNQDKVSQGTIASRDAEKICTLVEKVIAIHLLAATQACEIRNTCALRPKIASMIESIRSIADPVIEDRPMDADIENIAKSISQTDMFV